MSKSPTVEKLRDRWNKEWGPKMFCLFAFVFKVGYMRECFNAEETELLIEREDLSIKQDMKWGSARVITLGASRMTSNELVEWLTFSRNPGSPSIVIGNSEEMGTDLGRVQMQSW